MLVIFTSIARAARLEDSKAEQGREIDMAHVSFCEHLYRSMRYVLLGSLLMLALPDSPSFAEHDRSSFCEALHLRPVVLPPGVGYVCPRTP